MTEDVRFQIPSIQEDGRGWDPADLLRIDRDLCVSLCETSEIGDVIKLLIETALLLDCTDCSGAYYVDDSNGSMELIACEGWSQSYRERVSRIDSRWRYFPSTQNGDAVLSWEHGGFLFDRNASKKEEILCEAAFPIRYEERTIALLCVGSRSRDKFPDEILELIRSFAVSAGKTIARIYQDISFRETVVDYKALFESSDDLLFVLNIEGHILYLNAEGKKRIGYSEIELADMVVVDLFPPALREDAAAIIVDMLAGKESVCSLPLMAKDGTLIPVESKMHLVQTVVGERIVGIARDLKRQVGLEETLRESQETARALLNAPTDKIFLLDSQGIILAANETAATKYESLPDDMTGTSIQDWLPEDLSKSCMKHLKAVVRGKKPRRFEDFSEGRWEDTVAYPVFDSAGNVRKIAFVSRDITERKRFEKVLKESEEKYRIVVDNANEAIVVVQDEKLQFINPKALQLAGYSEEEVRNTPFIHFVYPDDRPLIAEKFRQRMSGKGTSDSYSFRIIAKNKHTRWVEVRAVLIDWEGEPASLTFLSDITERKLAEQTIIEAHNELENIVEERTAELLGANIELQKEIRTRKLADKKLKESEVKYRSLVENIPDLILSIDVDGRITTANSSACKILEYENGSDIVGVLFLSIVHPSDRIAVEETLQGDIQSGRKQNREMDFRIVTKSDSVRWVDANVSYRFDNRGKLIQIDGVLRDITHTKLLLERMIRSERSDATSQLARCLAHEINSPLQAVKFLMKTMEESHKELPGFPDEIALLKETFETIEHRFKNLINLHNSAEDRIQAVNVNDVITKTASLAKSHLMKNRIKLLTDLNSGIPDVVASPERLGQVFLYLIQNAVDAIVNSITDDSRGERPDPFGVISIQTEPAGSDCVRIRFSDNGPGFNEEGLHRLFDPMHISTDDRNAELALSVCHGIIEDYQGTIRASNSPQGGVVFDITLPSKSSPENQAP